MSKSDNSIFLGDEALKRADVRQHINLWDFMHMFFPETSNKKQADCACRFMKTLLEDKSVESIRLKEIVGEDYVNLVMFVIPKLEKFGLIKIIGDRGRGKAYKIELDKTFSERIRHIGLEWFRIYAKYGDSNGGQP